MRVVLAAHVRWQVCTFTCMLQASHVEHPDSHAVNPKPELLPLTPCTLVPLVPGATNASKPNPRGLTPETSTEEALGWGLAHHRTVASLRGCWHFPRFREG